MYTTSTISPTQSYHTYEYNKKQALISILESGFTDQNQQDQGLVEVIKKTVFADLTDKEVFLLAQAFKDVDKPIVGEKDITLSIQEKQWQEYLADHDQGQESDYEQGQQRAMDRIAQCLYGVSTYGDLLKS